MRSAALGMSKHFQERENFNSCYRRYKATHLGPKATSRRDRVVVVTASCAGMCRICRICTCILIGNVISEGMCSNRGLRSNVTTPKGVPWKEPSPCTICVSLLKMVPYCCGQITSPARLLQSIRAQNTAEDLPPPTSCTKKYMHN